QQNWVAHVGMVRPSARPARKAKLARGTEDDCPYAPHRRPEKYGCVHSGGGRKLMTPSRCGSYQSALATHPKLAYARSLSSAAECAAHAHTAFAKSSWPLLP